MQNISPLVVIQAHMSSDVLPKVIACQLHHMIFRQLETSRGVIILPPNMNVSLIFVNTGFDATIWRGLAWHYLKNVVPEAGIKGRDK